jgi:hypothetical protein
MNEQAKNECRCEKTTCGCAAVRVERCSCGERCACRSSCRCGAGCSCAAAK